MTDPYNSTTAEYQIPADITSNGKTLLYEYEKFSKSGKPNKKQEQRWLCTKSGQKCRAACSTKEVNGVLMMRIINSGHTHPRSSFEYPIVADITSDGINLLYKNEKFCKHFKANSKQEQRWKCTKGQNCNASCSTKEVNGVPMMKIIIAEHTHTSPKYPFEADVSSNGKTLLYEYEKFSKSGKPNKKQEQRWLCTKSGQKCRAACSTMEVNGVLMMRIINSGHTHPRSSFEYPIFADITSNGINILNKNEKFCKHGKANTEQNQRRKCTKSQVQNCHASCSKKEANGILMMKILKPEHTHEHGDVEMNGHASSFGP